MKSNLRVRARLLRSHKTGPFQNGHKKTASLALGGLLLILFRVPLVDLFTQFLSLGFQFFYGLAGRINLCRINGIPIILADYSVLIQHLNNQGCFSSML